MLTHPIRSKREYDAAQERVAELIARRAKKGTPLGDELEMLGLLITVYDDEHFPLGPSDPVAAIEFQMNQRGLTRKDLEPYIGNRARVSDIMNRRRALSLNMIRRLHSGLGIPFESLIAANEELEPASVD
ncbi:MAG: helix-turn-helix domain-containing protein [Planctomycetes bacterium]|nr:helix-turn-helix domain-containing protein [Planctomycetota bacterium]